MNKYNYIPTINSLDHISVKTFVPLKIISLTKPNDEPLTNQHENTNNHCEISPPQWVLDLNTLGKKGEYLALVYLKTIYKEVHWVADNTKLGYDIFADNNFFEVKTTENNGNTFYVSQNELITAFRNCNKYNIFFIKNICKNPVGYIVNDIFSSFKIEFEQLIEKSNMFDNERISMVAVNFKINLEDDYLNGLVGIDLGSYTANI